MGFFNLYEEDTGRRREGGCRQYNSGSITPRRRSYKPSNIPPRDRPISCVLLVQAEVVCLLLREADCNPLSRREAWWKQAYMRTAAEFLESNGELLDEFKRWSEAGSEQDFKTWLTKQYLDEQGADSV
jgi:hypothetical protein